MRRRFMTIALVVMAILFTGCSLSPFGVDTSIQSIHPNGAFIAESVGIQDEAAAEASVNCWTQPNKTSTLYWFINPVYYSGTTAAGQLVADVKCNDVGDGDVDRQVVYKFPNKTGSIKPFKISTMIDGLWLYAKVKWGGRLKYGTFISNDGFQYVYIQHGWNFVPLSVFLRY